MVETQTIFIIDPIESIAPLVRAIAAEMKLNCDCFLRGEEFLAVYSEDRPGCLVTEIRLMGINGIELQEALAANGISLPIVFVTSHAETRLTVRAMLNGAVTVLEKPPAEQELWDAIRTALTLDERTRRIDKTKSSVQQRLDQLTHKERQVLDLLIQGATNKTIANKLDVSVRTVETRRGQIFKKMKSDSIVELVRSIFILDSSGSGQSPP